MHKRKRKEIEIEGVLNIYTTHSTITTRFDTTNYPHLSLVMILKSVQHV